MHRPIALAALLASAPAATADTFLWKVSGGEGHLFLGGTLHVLDEDDYPLPAPFDTAYEAADTLVLETDPEELADPARQAELLGALTYDGGERIFDVLDDANDERLEAYLAERGLPVPMFATFRPGMLLTALTFVELGRLGVDAQGVDAHYQARASADGKPLVQLEAVEAQIDMLASLGEGDPNGLVGWLLDDMDRMGELMASMTAAWREGDPDEIERAVTAPMAERMPEGYASLLADRNDDWLPRIVDMLATDEVELVLVGAAHLVGEDGLLEALRDGGYELEQL